jgi:hypothetical protein
MELLTKAIRAQLLANGMAQAKVKGTKAERDFVPVVKLFGGGAMTWLFTELDEDGDTLFGLCDLGQGCPELGYASLSELASAKFPPFGLGIERDLYFKPTKPLSVYAEAAKHVGRIVENV